jgi:uncharacterized membrane protein
MKTLTTIMLAVLLCAGVARAQDSAISLPAQFEVAGVAADDRLNIRAEPSASAAIVGSYGPYAYNIEVLETTADGRWGLVGTSEGNGWVNMRYLARRDQPDPWVIPRPLVCLGTEPFWSMGLYPRGDEFTLMGEERRTLQATQDIVASNGFLARHVEGPSLERTLIVERRPCYDGMSDRRYGWSAMLFTEAPDESYVLTGCCTLDGNN